MLEAFLNYEQTLKGLTRYIYETGMLGSTPRSGLWLLGSGKQSVAEHTLHTIYISIVLAYLSPEADRDRMVMMALFHDLGEARTSDLNHLHQKYGRLDEMKAVKDLTATLPFGAEVDGFLAEAKAKETLEAKLVKDADMLEWIYTLRCEEVKGNSKAHEWIRLEQGRLQTPAGKLVGHWLVTTHPDEWWYKLHTSWSKPDAQHQASTTAASVSLTPPDTFGQVQDEVLSTGATPASGSEPDSSSYSSSVDAMEAPQYSQHEPTPVNPNATPYTYSANTFSPMSGIVENKAKQMFSGGQSQGKRQPILSPDMREEVIDPNFDFESPTVEIEPIS